MAPRALPWATDLLGFQPAQGRRQGFFRTISTYLIFLDFEHPTLQGVGNGDMVPRALPWATNLLGFQPAQGRRKGFFRTISTYLTFLDFEYSTYQKLTFVPSMKRA